MKDNDGNSMNLTKRVSAYGIASRRKAAELIKNGRVLVNGEVQTNPATEVTARDKVIADGKPCNSAPAKVYIMLNKPRGYVCTSEDPHAKKKALDLIELRGDIRLFSAGRLDKDSEGLIIFSNDGDFVERLSHPRNNVMKTYALSAEHPFTSEQLQQMCDGVESEGEMLHAEDIYQSGDRKYLIVLAEGKNREVRRLAEAFGNTAKRLERMAIGNLKRGMLKPGKWKFMSKRDIAYALSLEEDDPEMNAYPDDLLRSQLHLGRPTAVLPRAKRDSAGRKDFKSHTYFKNRSEGDSRNGGKRKIHHS